MESLIAKQNISRRFRQVPAVKKSSPLLAFGLSGQKPGKRPAVRQQPPRAPMAVARSSAGNDGGTFGARSFRGPDRPSRAGRGRGAGRGFTGLRRLLDLARVFAARLKRGMGRPARRDSPFQAPPSQDDRSSRRLVIVASSLAAAAAVLGLCLATLKLSESRFPVREADFALPAGELDLLAMIENAGPAEEDQADAAASADLPLNLAVTEYVLQRGDTLDSVAKRFGRDRDSIVSMNSISDVRRLGAGASLKIPNMNGIVHVVKNGDSLGKIASHYKVAITSILDANNLESYSIQRGQRLFIPGGKLDKAPPKRAATAIFAWPVRGIITSPFGYRLDPFTGVRRYHNGLDIAGELGQTIKAASAGRVAETGYNVTFGNYVIVSHQDGYQTFYAHLSKITVENGTALARGDKVGEMGNTGYSTGTHLHFGVYRRGAAVDPRRYLSK